MIASAIWWNIGKFCFDIAVKINVDTAHYVFRLESAQYRCGGNLTWEN